MLDILNSAIRVYATPICFRDKFVLMELIVFSLLLVHLHSKYSSSDPQILIKLLWSWIILCWPDSMGCCTRLGTAVMGNAPCSRQPSDGWASKGWSPPCEMGIQVRFMLVLNLPQVRYSSSWAGQEGTHGWQLDSEIEVMVLSFGFPSSQVRPLLNLLKLGGGVVSAPSAVQNKALSVFFLCTEVVRLVFWGKGPCQNHQYFMNSQCCFWCLQMSL